MCNPSFFVISLLLVVTGSSSAYFVFMAMICFKFDKEEKIHSLLKCLGRTSKLPVNLHLAGHVLHLRQSYSSWGRTAAWFGRLAGLSFSSDGSGLWENISICGGRKSVRVSCSQCEDSDLCLSVDVIHTVFVCPYVLLLALFLTG